ncbi:hypothetical protein DNTS_002648 [Danionella cerebrum]|uniref:RAS guanyl-releasing protein 2 n=1 Tax=Danionella cerebrum TaxID=2873325 RepID=A0A553QKK2_9TELE|nr:hypothetical protein DNTS_002648 [Danionella translucida]TRY90520.1 hypothetical protein DNTS_002648 [Danionella translucida]
MMNPLPVESGTVDELVDICIQSFDNEGSIKDPSFVRMFLMMHPWYLSSTDLSKKLLLKSEEGNSDEIRPKICHLVKYWISEFPAEFDLNPALAEKIRDLRENLNTEGTEIQSRLIDIESVPSYKWKRQVTQRVPSMSKRRKMSLLFDHLDPYELAEHLTYLEYKSFCKILFQDYHSFVMHGCTVDNPILERFITLFNSVSQWIQLMVLSKPSAPQRAAVIAHFLQVAQLFTSLLDMLTSSANYSQYRRRFAECSGFRFPILAVSLKDLIAVHVALPDWTDPQKTQVNLTKTHQLYGILQELTLVQNNPPKIEASMDLLNLLTVSLDQYHSEEEIYQLSLQREPRVAKPANSTPSPSLAPKKLSLIDDWAASVKPKANVVIISKHIQKMVDSVFKNFDTNCDGFISREEFECIRNNFPYLMKFGELDTNQDGKISREEMIEYFMKASSLLNCKMGFIHTFIENTYVKPTFCDHCTGFVICGVNCHKACHSRLTVECRKRTKSISLETPPSLQSRSYSLPLPNNTVISEEDVDTL